MGKPIEIFEFKVDNQLKAAGSLFICKTQQNSATTTHIYQRAFIIS